MGLLDDLDIIAKLPTRESLTRQATSMIKRRPTRRANKKKKPKSAKWLREFTEAKKQQALIKQQSKERAEHIASFNRNIA
ncbi:MAG: hypothetical protein C0429_09805 [Sphingopyxis sp.]|nr:hypothetical protein [Sphingopyxis sp.]